MEAAERARVKALPKRSQKGRALTRRQEEALVLIGDGLTFPQIADILGITPRGVKALSDKLRAKFDVTHSRELIPCARRYFAKEAMVPKKKGSR
jgi:DNA-binding CsgD family transcriptional regulator